MIAVHDAPLLAEQLKQDLERVNTLLERVRANHAYEGRSELVEIGDAITRHSGRFREVNRDFERLKRLGSQQTTAAMSFELATSDLEDIRSQFEAQVQGPLSRLLAEVEGAAAIQRWFSEQPKESEVVEIQKRWALFVGIGDYSRAQLGCLTTPRSDATQTRKLFLADERYQAQSENSRLLHDEEATRDAILSTLGDLVQAASGYDMLLFYFSGHGAQVQGESILVPYDYERVTPVESGLAVNDILVLMKSSKAQTKIVLLDACHSGPDISTTEEQTKDVGEEESKDITAQAMDPAFASFVLRSRGMAVMTSCTAQQRSWSYRATGLSAFTFFLLEGLSGYADTARNGYITVSDAFHYTSNAVRSWGNQKTPRIQQYPGLIYTTDGEVVLFDYPSGATSAMPVAGAEQKAEQQPESSEPSGGRVSRHWKGCSFGVKSCLM